MNDTRSVSDTKSGEKAEDYWNCWNDQRSWNPSFPLPLSHESFTTYTLISLPCLHFSFSLVTLFNSSCPGWFSRQWEGQFVVLNLWYMFLQSAIFSLLQSAHIFLLLILAKSHRMTLMSYLAKHHGKNKQMSSSLAFSSTLPEIPFLPGMNEEEQKIKMKFFCCSR